MNVLDPSGGFVWCWVFTIYEAIANKILFLLQLVFQS